jgi:hypothetical protein
LADKKKETRVSEENSARSIVAYILIPIFTFAAGSLISYWQFGKSQYLERIKVAVDISSNSQLRDDVRLQAWAKSVKERLELDTYRDDTDKQIEKELQILTLSKELRSKLCFKPEKLLVKPTPTVRDGDIKVGADAKLLMMKFKVDYKNLEASFDGLVDYLNSTCGILNRPEVTKPIAQ